MGFREIILADSPLAYWRFGETTGATAADASGNARTGTYTGGYTLGQGGAIASDADTGVLLNGTSGRITVADAAPLRLTTAGAVESWVKLATTPNAYGLVIGKAVNGIAAGIDYQIDTGSTGRLVRGIISNGSAFGIVTGATSLTSGVWHHLVFEWTGSLLLVYVNGVLDGSAAQTITAQSATHGVNLGSAAVDTAYLAGSLDEAAIYSAALGATKVRRHYTEGLASAGVKRPWTA